MNARRKRRSRWPFLASGMVLLAAARAGAQQAPRSAGDIS